MNSKNFPVITPKAPILILAGDIGNPNTAKDRYIRFIDETSKNFKLVLLCSGNHEYFLGEINKTNNLIKEICNTFDNVKFLNKTRLDLTENLTILGCTLWSQILEHQKYSVKGTLADFYQISNVDGTSLSIQNYNDLHESDLSWLTNEISIINSKRKILIITHHAPHMEGTSAPQFKNSSISSAFATDLSYLISDPVIAWCAGHSHWSYNFDVNGVRLISNQMGYPGERNTGYNPNFTFEV